MKKTYSKFISLLLAFSLLMTMFGVALADDNSETPKEPASIESGHSYSQAVEAGEAFRVRVTAKKAGDLILAISLSEKCDVSASVSGSGSALADTGDGKTFTCTRPVGFGAKIDVSVKTDKAVTVTLKTEVKEKIQEQPEEKQEEPEQDEPKQAEPKQEELKLEEQKKDDPVQTETISDVKEEAPVQPEAQPEEKNVGDKYDEKTEIKEEITEEVKEETDKEQQENPAAISQEQLTEAGNVPQPKETDDPVLEEVVEEQQLDLSLEDEDKKSEQTPIEEELKEEFDEKQQEQLPEANSEDLPQENLDEVKGKVLPSDAETQPADEEIIQEEGKGTEEQSEIDEHEEVRDSLEPTDTLNAKQDNIEENQVEEQKETIISESDIIDKSDEIKQDEETTPVEETKLDEETIPVEEPKEDSTTNPKQDEQQEDESTVELAEEEKTPLELPEDRSSSFEVLWDVENPNYGDVAHFVATVKGYDGLNYVIQWQVSQDDVNWEDIEGENGLTMDVVVTRENADYYWRLVIYVYETEPAAE